MNEEAPAGDAPRGRRRAERRERRRSRRARKEETRHRLLDAALALLSRHSFDSIGLRELSREAGVTPPAFYRHFDDLEELGLVLVEEAFGSLHELLREARAEPTFYKDVVRRSVAIVVAHVHAHRPHMRFIARERYGGVRRLRRMIRLELQLFANELAVDLARFPELEKWSREDRQMYADLLVDTVVTTAAALLDAAPEEEERIARRVERQLRLTVVGVVGWRPRAKG